MIHLLMPMSGQGTRYKKAGYTEPKPMIPVNGVPMVERLLGVFPADWPAHFVMAENHRATALPDYLRRLRPQSKQSFVPEHTKGPSFAVLEALKQIPGDEPVFVSYCDYGMVWDARQFERFVESTECDACVVSYRGFHAHYLNPVTYAYSRLNGERVVEVKEKGSFTENRENEYASSGGYYFRRASLLKEAIEFQMTKGLELNGEYYTSLTVQALLTLDPKAHVRVFEIPYFFQWGTPDDLKNFEYWERTFKAWNREQGRQKRIDQILMPMAGLGSRFQSLTDTPKPLIPVVSEPMYQAALGSLPRADQTVLVFLKRFEEALRKTLSSDGLHSTEVVALTETPSGQALSTEAGVSALEADKPVIVSSCDHGIVLSTETWNEFRKKSDCDAAIFTVRGFPGAARRPEAYAYVVPKAGERFPLVEKVSVKKPVSNMPSSDAVLVGTFWFKSAQVLGDGIEELKKRDVRVNGELYLDSVFEVLMSQGKRVRMIALDGYVNWGDPDSLAEALYWQECFGARRFDKREKFRAREEVRND